MRPRAAWLGALLAALALRPLGAAPSEAETGVPVGAETLLGAVGTLGGAGAYAAFMAIGALADGWARDIYDAATAVRAVTVLAALARTSASSLDALIDAAVLREDDWLYARSVIDVFRRLEDEAKLLVVWVETGERDAFDQARMLALKAITDTLAMSGEEALQ